MREAVRASFAVWSRARSRVLGSLEVVSVDRVVDIAWGELPPDGAQCTLQK